MKRYVIAMGLVAPHKVKWADRWKRRHERLAANAIISGTLLDHCMSEDIHEKKGGPHVLSLDDLTNGGEFFDSESHIPSYVRRYERYCQELAVTDTALRMALRTRHSNMLYLLELGKPYRIHGVLGSDSQIEKLQERVSTVFAEISAPTSPYFVAKNAVDMRIAHHAY